MATATLYALSGHYALNGGTWYVDSNCYASRSSSTAFYESKLSFSTSGLVIASSSNATLTFVINGQSNPYGTSVIITTTDLAASSINNATSESAVKALSGYVAHGNCTSHTSSANQQSGAVVSYSINTTSIRGNTTYYVYVKRRIGWANDGNNASGWTVWPNPGYNEANKSQTYFTITYTPGGYVRIYDGSNWAAYIPYIYNGSTWEQYIPYIYDGSNWVLYGG